MAGKIDTYFMAMAIELAGKGRGKTSPNPMVGALVVKDRSVVGQGYHMKAGSDHAEVVALNKAGEDVRGATLYVSMEPCCHHGKTPPCTEAIIKSGIKRVVAAMTDENPLICGNGMNTLAEAGVETEIGVLEKQARKLNEAYLKFVKSGLPFVTLKLATTLDGKIADVQGKSSWISDPETRKRVHQWRAWSDAVMVGVGTVLADNPHLTVRDAEGSDPVRIIVDSALKTPADANVLADSNAIIATTDRSDKSKLELFEKRNIEVWRLGDCNGKVSLPELLKKLGEHNIVSLLCEGGGTLASALLSERLVDKIIFTISPKILGTGLEALGDIGVKSIDSALELNDIEIVRIENDMIITGYPYYT